VSFQTVRASAQETLRSWAPADEPQELLRLTYLSYLAAVPDAVRRDCAAGHITASALICDIQRRRVLLTLHPRIGRWVQLGGHCEDEDVSLVGAALREAREESGIDDLTIDPTPLQVHTHALTCSGGVPTHHLDVQFLVTAKPGSIARISDESLDLDWFGIGALPAGVDASVVELVAAAARRIGGRS